MKNDLLARIIGEVKNIDLCEKLEKGLEKDIKKWKRVWLSI